AIKAHTEAAQLLDHCTMREVPVFGQDPETGVMVRGQLDALGDRIAVDIKTVREGAIGDFARQAVTYGYDVQCAAYADLLAWAGHPVEVVAFVL
ncbi:PD-(D/E)XK nuclease-like domain-containing protein, partial [Klebsiella pneumoniae]|nr:PD-(D/E)XK nuclease-like domain-containing protein [Klebsiella pneumoniae]